MKTYDEYYLVCKEECYKSVKTSEQMYGVNWWKKNNVEHDFIKPLHDISDAPIVKNDTNILNSKWNILHYMLSYLVLDYINERNINDDISSYSININLDKPNKKWSIYLKSYDKGCIELPESEPFDFHSYIFISDESIIKKFNDLNLIIYKYVIRFLDDNKKYMPTIVNNINFYIDYLEKGKSINYSDSSLSVGWDKTGDEHADELLVVSM